VNKEKKDARNCTKPSRSTSDKASQGLGNGKIDKHTSSIGNHKNFFEV